jgi:carbon monoxide dehydrogenase subunit G
MKVSSRSVVPSPAHAVWGRITDLEGMLAGLPGSRLARSGDSIEGSLKCKLGGMQITYRLTAGADVESTPGRAAVVAVSGKEARGGGTIAATLRVAVTDDDGGSAVDVDADIDVTGRGADAEEADWSRAIDGMVSAVAAPSARSPQAAAEAAREAPRPTERPPLAVAPRLVSERGGMDEGRAPADGRVPSDGWAATRAAQPAPARPLLVGLVVVAIVLAVRWLRGRRH